ncbi:MAG: transglycosylase domain-containing protein [Odoribacter splanchnicus]
MIFIIWYNILPVPLFQDPYATVLLDREGQVMGMKVADDGQMRFEEVQDLPPRYVISVLVFEDRYFLAHQGVNWWALCRALVQNIQAGHVVSGKYAFDAGGAFGFGKSARTVPEKIREIFLTLRMEQIILKTDFEMYASHTPFGECSRHTGGCAEIF